MTTISTDAPLSTATPLTQKAKKASRFDFSVSNEEFQALGLALTIIALWGGATAIFGYAGLIIGALTMVAVMYAVLVTISRG